MQHPFPTRTVKPAGRYGYRVHPERAVKQFHHAIDYTVPAGSDVRSIATGHVIAIRWDERLGHVIEIDHGGGYMSRYAHLANPGRVQLNDYVTADTVCAQVGATGTAARGAHLHLEVWHHGRHIDPAKILTERL